MNKRTRIIALSAVMAALSVVFLFFASAWPTGQLGLVALSSIFAAAAIVEGGLVSGIYVYVVTAAIGLLLIPNKIPPLLYLLFFGYYPALKSLIEKIRNVTVQTGLKLVAFNAALTAVWLLLSEAFMGFAAITPGVWFVYIVGSIVFMIYDYGFTKVIWLYISRVSGRMRS